MAIAFRISLRMKFIIGNCFLPLKFVLSMGCGLWVWVTVGMLGAREKIVVEISSELFSVFPLRTIFSFSFTI